MSFQNVQGVKVENNPILVSGRKAITGASTATPLATSSIPCKGLFVSPDLTAGQPISIGDSNVAAGSGLWRGVILVPGNNPIFVPTDDVSKVYFNSDSASAVACFTYFV